MGHETRDKNMGNKRPEREAVESALLQNPKRRAYEIADEVGITDTMGYDRAVRYVLQVKKSMKSKGQIKLGHFAPDHERLQDIETLFEIRDGSFGYKESFTLLLLNCYYRLRSDDDNIHMGAIDDTYEKNKLLVEHISMYAAIKICDVALAYYKRSIDDELNAIARKKGLPNAGINYTDERFVEKLGIRESELPLMISLAR